MCLKVGSSEKFCELEENITFQRLRKGKLEGERMWSGEGKKKTVYCSYPV